MTIPESSSQQVSAAAAAYPGVGETGRLRGGRLRFFRTIAESVGVQGPTAAVVISAAVLASVSGGGTALVQIIAAVAMGFVAIVTAGQFGPDWTVTDHTCKGLFAESLAALQMAQPRGHG